MDHSPYFLLGYLKDALKYRADGISEFELADLMSRYERHESGACDCKI